MKKWIAFMLIMATLVSLGACSNNKGKDNKETTAPTISQANMPESALALMEKIWASFAENERFPAMGGNYDEDETKNNIVDNGPGKYDLGNDGVTTVLMVPGENMDKIAEVSSLMHGMMANNFTCGAYKLKDGSDAKAFGEAMYKSIVAQRFLCGAPEAVFVAHLGNDYVVAAYGLKDLMDLLNNKLVAAYPGAQVLYSEMIPA